MTTVIEKPNQIPSIILFLLCNHDEVLFRKYLSWFLFSFPTEKQKQKQKTMTFFGQWFISFFWTIKSLVFIHFSSKRILSSEACILCVQLGGLVVGFGYRPKEKISTIGRLLSKLADVNVTGFLVLRSLISFELICHECREKIGRIYRVESKMWRNKKNQAKVMTRPKSNEFHVLSRRRQIPGHILASSTWNEISSWHWDLRA